MSREKTFVRSAAKTAAVTALNSLVRSTAAILGTGVVVLLAIVVMIAATLFVVTKLNDQDCETPGGNTNPVNVGNVTLDPKGLTVQGAAMDTGREQEKLRPEEKQSAIVATLVSVIAGRKSDFPGVQQQRITEVALATGIVESKLSNLDYGDRDSLGVYQQRPSQGWGTEAQVRNVVYATNAFLDEVLTVENWKTIPRGELAQRVQRSGFPERYDEQMHEAEAIYKRLRIDGNPTTQVVSHSTTTGDCDDSKTVTEAKVGVALGAARKLMGTTPSSTVKNGADLVRTSYAKAGVPLPKTAEGIATHMGSEEVGVKTTWYPAKDVLSGSVIPRSGDILCYSTKPNPTREDCETVGLVESAPLSINGLTVATFNVEGSSHRPRSGPQSGKEVIKRQAALIKRMGFSVVGLQELQSGQRANLVKALGPGYGVYPSTSNYGKAGMAPGVESVNSIVVDLSQIEVVGEESSLPMPLYFGGNRKHIPLLKLRHKASGQVFYMLNEHDPAHPQHTKARVINFKVRAGQYDRLSTEGIPIVSTGDFNSGFVVYRGGANPTLGGLRSNLAYCILTASGTMVNSYDASRSPLRTGCSEQTSKERGKGDIDHIYVSRGVDVTKWEWIDKKTTESDHRLLWIAVGTPGGTQKPAQASELGYYIGLNPATGTFTRMPVSKAGLVGIQRLTIRQPEMAVGDGKWVLPLSSNYRLTATFNQAGDKWASNHTGLDFAPNTGLGTPIRAVTGGTVSTGRAGAYGNRTVIKSSDGSEVWYCHQDEYAITSGTVQAGQVIGYVGSTGNSTGPHLHLEVRLPNGTAVDPMEALREHGLDP